MKDETTTQNKVKFNEHILSWEYLSIFKY